MKFELIKDYLLDAQLVDVTLMNMKTKRTEESIMREDLKVNISIATESKVSKKRDNIGFSFLTVTFGEEEDASIYAKLEYRGEFEFSNSVPEEKFITVLDVVGVKSLWPYVRAMLSKITTEMGIPTYTLPTIDVIKMIEDN